MSDLSAADEERIVKALASIERDVIPLARALQSLRASVLGAQQAMETSLKDADKALYEVANKIQPLAFRADEAANAIEAASARVIAATDSLEQLIDAAENADTPISGLSTTISETATEIRDSFRAAVEEWMEAQRDVLDEQVLQAGEELREKMAEPVVAAIEDLFDDVSEAVHEHVVEVLQPVADDVAASVDELLDELVDRLAGGDQETRNENLSMKPVMEVLRPAVDAMIGQVERVKPLAAMVGMG